MPAWTGGRRVQKELEEERSCGQRRKSVAVKLLDKERRWARASEEDDKANVEAEQRAGRRCAIAGGG